MTMSSPTVLETPCREWRGAQKGAGAKVGRGYGNVYRDGRYQSLHKYIWEMVNGPVPEGMVVMHRCDNPPCFRYDHLRLGTPAENRADMHAKGRARGGRHQALKTHCPKGHPYDEANTYHPPKRPDHRDCRACQSENSKAQWKRKKGLPC